MKHHISSLNILYVQTQQLLVNQSYLHAMHVIIICIAAHDWPKGQTS